MHVMPPISQQVTNNTYQVFDIVINASAYYVILNNVALNIVNNHGLCDVTNVFPYLVLKVTSFLTWYVTTRETTLQVRCLRRR
jgi:hypothetical protein